MKCRDIGPLDAKIMLVGEAPGSTEAQLGIPFVGQAGILLKSICKAAGVDYSKCYVTNISNERPPNNKFGYFYEDAKRSVPKENLRKCWFELGDKIKRIKPKVVICLGAEPLRAVTNLHGIESWRGTRIDAYDTKVIATFHPSNILRIYSRRVIAEMDMRKAKREAEGLIYKEPEIIISPTLSAAIKWLTYVRNKLYQISPIEARKNLISFDIETIGKRIRSIAFAYRDEDRDYSAISIPFFRMLNSASISTSVGSSIISMSAPDINYWQPSDEELILDAIAKIMESDHIAKVGQNSIQFDSPLIKAEFGIDTNNHAMDLMHAWHVLYPSLPKSLSFISSILTDHPNYWTKKETQIDESEWLYNAMDAIVTLESAIKVKKDLKEEGLSDLYYNHVHPLTFDLLKASERGVTWDKDEADKMKIRLKADLDKLTAELTELVGSEFNPNSPKQVKHLLYDKLGFPTIYKRGTRNATTDEDAIRRLQTKYPNEPALSKIIQFRKTSKLISTYVNVSLDKDGRVRCSYNPSGTITGRIASSKTIWGTGMDLHNIPKGYTRGSESTRHLYTAAEGNIFVVGDLKQAEAMVVAWLLKALGDPTLFDEYHDPSFDIHRWCAALVYDVLESDVTKDQRQQGGKLANHSGNYMAGPSVMEKRALKDGYKGFTFTKCKRILQARLGAIPGLRLWWQDVERRLRATRTLTTCFGRRLHFFGRLDGEDLRSAIAFEPQSTVGDVCNKMFITLSNQDHYWPTLTTHDEIVLECKEEHANLAAKAMLEASKIPLNLRPNLEELVIPIEIQTGKNWQNLTDWS